jgi:hypothetical protein
MDEKRNAPLVVELPTSAEDVTPETAPVLPEMGLGGAPELYRFSGHKFDAGPPPRPRAALGLRIVQRFCGA